MPNDFLAPLLYMLLGALILIAAQQFMRLVPRAARRIPHTERFPVQRSNFPSNRQWLWDNLTTREMQIARLVAQGKHNSEVARELQISQYTVETHLKHIYAKLNVGSRTELAHVLRELVD